MEALAAYLHSKILPAFMFGKASDFFISEKNKKRNGKKLQNNSFKASSERNKRMEAK